MTTKSPDARDDACEAVADRDAANTANTAGRRAASHQTCPHEGEMMKQIQESEVVLLHRIIAKQRDLLNGVSVALRGPEPEMTSWSHHDLPDRAAEVVKNLAERDALCESQTRTIKGFAELKGSHERLRPVLVDTLTNVGESLPTGRNPEGTNEDPCAPGVIRSSIKHLAAERDRYRKEMERLEGLVGEEARLIAERDASESREHALGVQVESLRERVRLVTDVVKVARDVRRELTCSRDRGYMAPHKKCRSCWTCKIAASFDVTLAAYDAVPGDSLAVSTTKADKETP